MKHYFLSQKSRPWVLVTGASSGIGEAFAKQIAASGYHVILVARRSDHLERLAGDLRTQFSAETLVIPADLAAPDASEVILQKIDEQKITIELFFNNAGYGLNGDFCELGIAEQTQMIDVNCRALVALSHAVASRMRKARRGTIIHTASLGGLSPTPYYAVYGATKAFIVAFSEALGEELKPFGVKVKTLCPGATESEFASRSGFRGELPPKSAFQSSQSVADELIKSLAKPQSLVVLGRHNRLAACAMRFLPRSWVLQYAARSMRPRLASEFSKF